MKKRLGRSGYIYCFYNPCIRDGILKTGYTARTIEDRLKEANSRRRKKTWIPPSKYRLPGFSQSKYTCVYYKKVKSAFSTEQRLFKLLSKYSNRRIDQKKEFFDVDVIDVKLNLKIIQYDNIIAECDEIIKRHKA